ncbi:MMB_0454 family protein [Mesomycoplasma molare]|uniref:Uncharacterized protein n=1 Tax=Mesomycoplasma molare TaxID=171288 RepID=A0ABY5TTK3_9BACT|nr:hypothetical protein [Mesomycoplasma molare]UWD33994.1 hypothetical protein NX772_02700 [Mesomycoplasma molare]
MNYVIVNYGLNQVYTVYKQAFIQTIKAVFSKNPNVKLENNIEIKFNSTNTNISMILSFFTIENKKDFTTIFNNLINSLKETINLLIGTEPENISLLYKGKIANKKN